MTISDKIIDKYLFSYYILSSHNTYVPLLKKIINLKKILTIKYPNMAKNRPNIIPFNHLKNIFLS